LRALTRIEFGGVKNHNKRIIVTSPVLPLEEALEWRDRLLSSRAEGWEVFKGAWIDMLQHRSYKHKRPLTNLEATAFVEDKGHAIEPLLSAMLERRQQRQVEGERRAQQRVESQLCRALKLVQKALDSEQAASRQRELEIVRAREKLRLKRKQWLERKPAKDMTMEDLMAEMPAYLQKHPK